MILSRFLEKFSTLVLAVLLCLSVGCKKQKTNLSQQQAKVLYGDPYFLIQMKPILEDLCGRYLSDGGLNSQILACIERNRPDPNEDTSNYSTARREELRAKNTTLDVLQHVEMIASHICKKKESFYEDMDEGNMEEYVDDIVDGMIEIERLFLLPMMNIERPDINHLLEKQASSMFPIGLQGELHTQDLAMLRGCSPPECLKLFKEDDFIALLHYVDKYFGYVGIPDVQSAYVGTNALSIESRTLIVRWLDFFIVHGLGLPHKSLFL